MAFFHGINGYGNGPASQRVVDGDIQDLKGIVGTGRKPDIKKLQELEIKAKEHERASNDVNRQIGRIEDDFRAIFHGVEFTVSGYSMAHLAEKQDRSWCHRPVNLSRIP